MKSTNDMADRPKEDCWWKERDGDIAFVFVHGFLSSAKCWEHPNGTFWPDLIASDPQFDQVSIFLTHYSTSISAGIYDTNQCSRAVYNALRFRQAGEKNPLDFGTIIFVCHSLGGIVARRILEQYRESFTDKRIGLVLIASPSLGSTYAATFKRIIRLYKNKTAEQLNRDSETLIDLDNRFRDLLLKNSFSSLTGAEACENHGPVWSKYLPLRTRPIVDAASASRYFGGVTIVEDSDHFSICKPDSTKHPIHKFLKLYFHDHIKIQQDAAVTKPPSRSPVISSVCDPLFDVYGLRHRNAYLVRDEDNILASALK